MVAVTKREINCCDDFWPIHYRNDINRVDTIRIKLKNLLCYSIFVIISTIVIISTQHPLLFAYTKEIENHFIDVKFPNTVDTEITLDEIRTISDVYAYWSLIMFPCLHESNWAIDYLGPMNYLLNESKKTILEDNTLLGELQFRLIEISDEYCEVHPSINKKNETCFGPYIYFNQLRDPRNPTEIKGNTYLIYIGAAGIYPSSGDTNVGIYHKFQVAYHLQTKPIFQFNHRAILMEFTLFNANLNLFCNVKLVFEQPACGGIIATSQFISTKLRVYDTEDDFKILGLEIVYMCYILYFIIKEIRNMCFHGKKYFTLFWSHVNIFIIIGSLILIPFNLYKFYILPDIIKKVAEKEGNYVSEMETLAFWQWTINNIYAILLFFIWIQIFRFLDLNRALRQFSATLRKCANELAAFAIMFLIIFLSFALMGYILFGEQCVYFSTIPKSLMTLLITVLGDFDYYTVEKQNRLIAPIFITIFIFLVFFLLLNMFVAIITDTYAEVKYEMKTAKSELGIFDFLLRLPTKIIRCCYPEFKSLKRDGFKLSQNEALDEIKKILILGNFTRDEIDKFFEYYRAITEDIETEEYEDIQFDLLLNDIRKHKPAADIGQPEKKQTMHDFEKYQERLDTITMQFHSVHERYDKLIEHFASIGK